MRIKSGQHTVDGGFDQFRIIGLLDIIAAHTLQHIAKQIKLLVNFRVRRRRRIRLGDIEDRRHSRKAGHHHEAPKCEI